MYIQNLIAAETKTNLYSKDKNARYQEKNHSIITKREIFLVVT